MRRILFIAISLSCAASALASGKVLIASKGWAAIDRGDQCDARARAMRIAAKGKVQAIAGFVFTPDRRRWGQFYARLSRRPRAGSSVLVTVSGRPFLLSAGGGWAWSGRPDQGRAIIDAVRGGGQMRIEARDERGVRFVDYFSLDGAPTAIDAAAAHCASGRLGLD
jgi:hypothetical protein